MGTLVYGFGRELRLDDRLLAHLRVAITSKLQAQESFMLDLDGVLDEDTARRCVWLHPAIPIEFVFDDSSRQTLNRHWIEALMRSSQSIRGMLAITEEQVEDYLRQAGAPTPP
ncbi:DUF7882 family protein [Gryllotalpicola ginsengisoli]|uniref:DUF7882 family protein n=1 Tax=Gryllotalpicola ginsengisoli TaxID=444608 RepID=UPI0003B3B9ED|nr:hypothetical protein [Gryllotalpicola ginsengisoli]